MATTGKTDEELWRALEGLDDDLLDPDLPEDAVDKELLSLGIDPVALARRTTKFVQSVKEEERLSWQELARRRKVELESLASQHASVVDLKMSRAAILARLDELRAKDPMVGSAIRMAARKRRPEESTDDELRLLLQEMEALRAIDDE